MKRIFTVLFLLCIFSEHAVSDPSQFSNLLTDDTDYSGTWVDPDALSDGGVYVDPIWGTRTTKIYSPTDCAISCEGLNFYPDYAKQQAWNSDGSKFLLTDGNAWHSVYDSSTLQQLRRITVANGPVSDNDVRWSHSDPDIIYFVKGMDFKSYDYSTDTVSTIHTFSCTDGENPGTKLANGDEGNSSSDDRYWAFKCMFYDGSFYNTIDLIVYDRTTDTVISQVPVDTVCGGDCSDITHLERADWIGMSPSGNYVIVQWKRTSNIEANYARPMGTELFDRDLSYQGKLAATFSHGDIGYAANGDEVWVSEWNSTYDSDTFKWRKLADLSEGEINIPSSSNAQSGYHISMRALNEPGWALLSVYDVNGSIQGTGWGAAELVALEIDTSISNNTSWYRIGRTVGIKSSYYAEPHATVNQNFTKILWGSNWGVDDGQISAYMITLTNPRLRPSLSGAGVKLTGGNPIVLGAE